ncbi:Hsp70 family protein [Desulfobacca acetoxidans]
MILGIDLGTTQSCVAVPARPEHSLGEPVEIIRDEFGNRTTPSVVAEDSNGNIVVGDLAKQRAGLQPKPIFFIKRFMGTDHIEKLLGRNAKPEDFSAETLKYLKKIAEDYLGVRPLTQAVICVPAYFDLIQVQATKKAGTLAGLNVVAVLMEPIAAALAYGLEIDEADRKIFCYDLGGGTFDATVLDRGDGEPRVLAFGGDHFLGGCDFDKLLAKYFLERLQTAGYKLDLDFNRKEDDARWQVLLLTAEKYKHKLSDHQQVPVREVEFIKDQNGRLVTMDFSLKRKEFEGLIRGEEDPELEQLFHDYLEEGKDRALKRFLIQRGDYREEEITPDHLEGELLKLEKMIQDRAPSIKNTRYLSIISLMKAGVFPQDIDDIIMVGGSSHIPLVREELRRLFGREPQLVNPDTSIAVGAALKARDLGTALPAGLKHFRPPFQTSVAIVALPGTLEAQKLGVPFDRVTVRLHRAPDLNREATPDSQGNFRFENVPLLEECDNRFQLAVLERGGEAILTHDFTITHDSEAEPPPPPVDTDFLTKPIFIETVHGPERVFNAGDKIPKKVHLTKKTADQSGIIRVPILEGLQVRGEILIEAVNPGLPVGTPVEIDMEVSKDRDIIGTARVPADAGKKASMTAQLSEVALLSREEMEQEFEGKRDRFDEILGQVADRNLRVRLRREGKHYIENIDREIKETDPNLPKIASLLIDLDHLMRKISEEISWSPTTVEFAHKIDQATTKDKAKGGKYAENILALKNAGEEAAKNRDKKEWRYINEKLDEVLRALIREAGDAPPHPLLVQMFLLDELRKLSEKVQALGREKEFAQRLRTLKHEIENVNVAGDERTAFMQLVNIFRNKFQPLQYEATGERTGLPGFVE